MYLIFLATVIDSGRLLTSGCSSCSNPQGFAQAPAKGACSFQLSMNLENLELPHPSSIAREKPIWEWSQLRQGKAKRQRKSGIWWHFNPGSSHSWSFFRLSFFRHISKYDLFSFKSILIVICNNNNNNTEMLPKTHFVHSHEHAGGSHWFIEISAPAP